MVLDTDNSYNNFIQLYVHGTQERGNMSSRISNSEVSASEILEDLGEFFCTFVIYLPKTFRVCDNLK